jgi:hypothetical protein
MECAQYKIPDIKTGRMGELRVLLQRILEALANEQGSDRSKVSFTQMYFGTVVIRDICQICSTLSSEVALELPILNCVKDNYNSNDSKNLFMSKLSNEECELGHNSAQHESLAYLSNPPDILAVRIEDRKTDARLRRAALVERFICKDTNTHHISYELISATLDSSTTGAHTVAMIKENEDLVVINDTMVEKFVDNKYYLRNVFYNRVTADCGDITAVM